MALNRLLHRLMPAEPEVLGLLALMLLHESRRPARATAEGDIILLEDQDRSQWDGRLIAEGTLDGLHHQARRAGAADGATLEDAFLALVAAPA